MFNGFPRFKKKDHKYGAKATNGFPSKLESALNDLLVLREKAGEISELKRQQTVVLQDGPSDVRIAWKVDFSFIENGELCYAEAKGIETGEYILKLKMWRYQRPHKLYIFKGSHLRLNLVETILKKETA